MKKTAKYKRKIVSNTDWGVIEYGQMTQISVWEIYSQYMRVYTAAKYPSHTRVLQIF